MPAVLETPDVATLATVPAASRGETARTLAARDAAELAERLAWEADEERAARAPVGFALAVVLSLGLWLGLYLVATLLLR